MVGAVLVLVLVTWSGVSRYQSITMICDRINHDCGRDLPRYLPRYHPTVHVVPY
jgi:hypothetical protein